MLLGNDLRIRVPETRATVVKVLPNGDAHLMVVLEMTVVRLRVVRQFQVVLPKPGTPGPRVADQAVEALMGLCGLALGDLVDTRKLRLFRALVGGEIERFGKLIKRRVNHAIKGMANEILWRTEHQLVDQELETADDQT